jgi:hypothetical protein
MPDESPPPIRFWRIEQYEDDAGRSLLVRVPPENGAPREYIGRIVLQGRAPNGAVFSQPFAFRIEADGVREAFERFTDAGKAAVDAERKKVHLLVPTGAAAPSKVLA